MASTDEAPGVTAQPWPVSPPRDPAPAGEPATQGWIPTTPIAPAVRDDLAEKGLPYEVT